MVIVGSHSSSVLNVNPQATIANEWKILGSRNVTKPELAEAVSLVAAGRVRLIVTARYPLGDVEMLHERLRRREIAGRVVVEPG